MSLLKHKQQATSLPFDYDDHETHLRLHKAFVSLIPKEQQEKKMKWYVGVYYTEEGNTPEPGAEPDDVRLLDASDQAAAYEAAMDYFGQYDEPWHYVACPVEVQGPPRRVRVRRTVEFV